MDERMPLGGQIAEFAKKTIFGPETKGVIEAVKKDSYDPRCWHILIRTDKGELKHFSNTNIDMAKIKIGENFVIRTRGTSLCHPPGSKIARDPFNLQESKPE